MKTLPLLRPLANPLSISIFLFGAFSPETMAAPPDAPTLVERGPHHRVFQTIHPAVTSSGQTIDEIHHYTELAAGLNYLDENGQWIESQETIEPVAEGAIANHGQHKVLFRHNLNSSGSIELTMPGQTRIRANILGLAYKDSSTGRSVLLAEVKDSLGEISKNRVIFRDAFASVAGGLISADVLYTYRKGSFEQDVIFRANLPHAPLEYGLNPETTEIAVITEFVEAPEPAIIDRSIKNSSALSGTEFADQTLDFGGMQMILGHAFSLPRNRVNAASPIGKEWQHSGARKILVESVRHAAVRDALAELPPPQGGGLPDLSKVKFDPELPAPRPVDESSQPMEQAVAPIQETGVVLDYYLVTSQTSWTFAADQTYLISGTVYISQSATFQAGSVIKFTVSADLMVSGSLVSPSGGSKAILTAIDDDSVGEIIPGSTTEPTGVYATQALFLYNVNANTVLSNFQFRYALYAIDDYSPSGSHTVSACDFVNCSVGINANSTTIYLQNTNFMCDVTQPTVLQVNGSVVGTCTTLVGSQDSDADGLSNFGELTAYFTDPLIRCSRTWDCDAVAVLLATTQSGQTVVALQIIDGDPVTLVFTGTTPNEKYLVLTSQDFVHYKLEQIFLGATGANQTTAYVAKNGRNPLYFLGGLGKDSDNDGLPDAYEYMVTHTSPNNHDSDGNQVYDGGEDFDGDRKSNVAEMKNRAGPSDPFQTSSYIVPKTLLVYYGYPSLINGAANMSAALAEFKQYDYVVLGGRSQRWTSDDSAYKTANRNMAGLEEDYPSHPTYLNQPGWEHDDHQNTKAILARAMMEAPNTMFFGYIALGTRDIHGTQHLAYTPSEIQQHINWWKAMKVDGIFLDEFDFDFMADRSFEEGRQRQTNAVDRAHAKGFPVIANGFHQDQVLGNPAGVTTAPHLGQVGRYVDFYFYEDHQINKSAYMAADLWKAKADSILNDYQANGQNNNHNFNVLSITTAATGDPYSESKFWYSWYSALLYGHEATGWGEPPIFSLNSNAPLRARPSIVGDPGTNFTDSPTWSNNNTQVTRHNNNSRPVTVNTGDHSGNF